MFVFIIFLQMTLTSRYRFSLQFSCFCRSSGNVFLLWLLLVFSFSLKLLQFVYLSWFCIVPLCFSCSLSMLLVCFRTQMFITWIHLFFFCFSFSLHSKIKCAEVSQQAPRVVLFMCRISCVLCWMLYNNQWRTQEMRHIKSTTRFILVCSFKFNPPYHIWLFFFLPSSSLVPFALYYFPVLILFSFSFIVSIFVLLTSHIGSSFHCLFSLFCVCSILQKMYLVCLDLSCFCLSPLFLYSTAKNCQNSLYQSSSYAFISYLTP